MVTTGLESHWLCNNHSVVYPPTGSASEVCHPLPLLLLQAGEWKKGQWYFDLYTHTHTFNGPLSGTTRVSRYQKGKTNLDFTEARDSEWQWYQLDYMQVCTSLQTDNHASTPPLSFLQAGCPSCRPTDSVKAPIYVQQVQVTLILSPEKWTRTMLWIVLDGESW